MFFSSRQTVNYKVYEQCKKRYKLSIFKICFTTSGQGGAQFVCQTNNVRCLFPALVKLIIYLHFLIYVYHFINIIRDIEKLATNVNYFLLYSTFYLPIHLW